MDRPGGYVMNAWRNCQATTGWTIINPPPLECESKRHRRGSVSSMWIPHPVFAAVLVALLAIDGFARADVKEARKITYKDDIVPIFEGNCYKCHGPDKQESDFRLDTPEGLMKGGKVGPAIVPGKSAESHLVQAVEGTSKDIVAMPPEDAPLSAEQIETLKRWIDAGAKFK